MKHFTPEQYLKIDIANTFGLDKKTWQERIHWFDANESRLESLVEKADEPACFYAGMKAWYKYQSGQPIGYAIGLDATSSGIQIFSVLSRDKKAAKLCNVLPREEGKEHRENIYKTIYDSLGLENIDMIYVKKAIMTSFYGSLAKPKEVFKDKLDIFINTMKTEMPFAWALNSYCLKIWDNSVLNYRWAMPDGFDVFCEVEGVKEEEFIFNKETYSIDIKVNSPKDRGRFLGANLAHSCDALIVREITRMAMHDPKKINYIKNLIEWDIQPTKKIHDSKVERLWNIYKESGFLSYRILDYLHEGNIYMVDKNEIMNLINHLPKKPFKIYSIHDCFKCHPNYGNDIREMYKLQLAKLCKSNFLNYWLKQVRGDKYEEILLNDDFSDEIMEKSEYALS